jgi:hypothetical protein
MARKKPIVNIGSTQKKRDREFFKNFVLEVIEDTFINEFIPTSISLDVETETLFTLVLNGYRFVYEDLVVSDSKDYLDVYLYGVKQIDNYTVNVFDSNGLKLPDGDAARNGVSIQIIFEESITRVPNDVVRDFDEGSNSFEIKGKITQIV